MHVITTGWSFSWSSPIFSLSEAQVCVSTVYVRDARALAKVCAVSFKGASYPDIAFYTSATYNVPGYGVDKWWAVAPYTARHRGKIILNTSARMNGRWRELYPDHAVQLSVLTGLMGHETSHLMLATMSQSYGFPPSPAYVALLQKYYGKPKLQQPTETEMFLNAELELGVKPTFWQRLKRRLVPERMAGIVPDDDTVTAESLKWYCHANVDVASS